MSTSLPKTKILDSLTPKQRRALKIMIEDKENLSLAQILKKAGYSDTVILHPGEKFLQSQGVRKVLTMAGVSLGSLAKEHKERLASSHIDSIVFPAVKFERKVTKDAEGRKLKKPTTEIGWRHVPDEVIRTTVESVAGVKLLYIQKGYDEKRAHMQVPDNQTRIKAVDMGYRALDVYSADKLEVTVHDLTPEEQAILDAVFDEK